MPLYLPSFIGIFLLLPFAIAAQTYNNITKGSLLTAGDTSSSWVSPSKHFAFGFQEIQPGNFLLSIWFNQIPEMTITWSANRDRLAPSGSKVEFTNTGVVLTDPNGNDLWRPKLLSGGTPTDLALLDTGNLVLSAQPSVLLWQSFNDPTDTLLPTQTLNQGSQLIARYSENNYSSGRFSFQLTTDGNLALYTTNFPLYDSLNSHYLDYENTGLGFQVVFNQSGLLCLVANDGTILTNMFSENQLSKHFMYQRVILEYDGVLRHYVNNGSSGWSVTSFAPDNICTAVIQQTGSGVCGYNSYCQFGNDSKPHCLCPPGYSLMDPNYEMGGCNQNFQPQSCQDQRHEKNKFDLEVLKDVDWPLADYEHFQNVSKDWCRQVCLDDCFCAVGIFKEGGDCWKKKLPLSNGKTDNSVERTAFIKVRTSGDLREKNYRKENRGLMALLVTSGGIIIILVGLIMVVVCLFVYHKQDKQGLNGSKLTGTHNIRSFSYKELDVATTGFTEELGRGAFGVVYKGVLGESSGSKTFIAVKILDRLSQDADKEFKAEVNSLGLTHHKNLVKLFGFCDEGQRRILVYEFMSNGTLSEYISEPPKPAWGKRLQIVQDVAQGLFYLHEGCNSQIIHCDIKPQNILLDDDHNGCISDFGLAKLLRLDQTHTNTVARGTRGYVAPEWFWNTPVTAKVDVYSFGVLLLEVICCQRNVQAGNNEEHGVFLLTDWAFDCYRMNTLDDLVNDDMEALADKSKLEQMVRIAIWCTQVKPNLRPTMKIVVQMLEGVVQVPEPPNPTTSYSSPPTEAP